MQKVLSIILQCSHFTCLWVSHNIDCMPHRAPIVVSEIHISDYESPSSRLDNIGEFLRTAQTYETLGLSRIEGIENFHARCQLLLTNLKKKPYNPLEHRKQDFDVDYQDFKTQLKEFEVRNHLTGTINSCEYCYWVFTLCRFNCKHTWTSTFSRQRQYRGQLSSLSVLKGMQSTLVAVSEWAFLHH